MFPKKSLKVLLSIFTITLLVGLGFRVALALNYIDFSGTDTQDIRWPAGQTLSFVQGGAERTRIDATTGNVVIPQGLTVSGTFNMTGTYTGSVSAGNVTSGDFGSNYSGGNFSFPANVGIGTTAPGGILDIAGAGAGSTDVMIRSTKTDSTGESAALLFKTSGTQTVGIINGFDQDYVSSGQYMADALVIRSLRSGGLNLAAENASGDIRFYPCSVGTPALTVYRSGNVGIGTTSPASKLHIPNVNLNSAASGLTLEGGWPWTYYKDNETNQPSWVVYGDNNYYVRSVPYADRNSSDLSTVGNIWLTIGTGGNVGIGTTSPTQQLHIYGDNTDSIGIRISNITSGGETWRLASNGASASPGAGAFSFYNVTDDAYRLVLAGNGNVGIGTTSPGAKLDVTGSIIGTDLSINGSNTAVISINPASTYAAYINYGGSNPNLLQIGSESGAGGYISAGSAAYSGVISTSATYPLHLGTSGSVKMTILSNGDVGIGYTDTSGNKLAVNGAIYSSSSITAGTQLCIGASCQSSWPGSQWAASGNNIYNTNSGNVGIGTTGPTSKLQIGTLDTSYGSAILGVFNGETTDSQNQYPKLLISDDGNGHTPSPQQSGIALHTRNSTANGWSPYLGFSVYEGGATTPRNSFYAAIAGQYKGDNQNPDWKAGDIAFFTRKLGGSPVGMSEVMRVTNSGNVGIGYTDTYGNKLAVNGAIYSPTSITAGTQLCIGASCQSSWPGSQWAASGNNIYNTNSGNVGIGTTGPPVKFQVVQNIADWTGDFKNYTAGAYGLRIDLSGSSGSQAALQVYTATGGGM